MPRFVELGPSGRELESRLSRRYLRIVDSLHLAMETEDPELLQVRLQILKEDVAIAHDLVANFRGLQIAPEFPAASGQHEVPKN